MAAGKTVVTFYMMAVVSVIMINLAASDSPSTAADSPAAAISYINHTVGGAAGWFFNSATNQSSFDYTAWAATQTFNLGDYLIFNTDTNTTVIQTYNLTTYQSCSIDESDSDTFEYMSGNSDFGVGVVMTVALTIVGDQYYFSNADDGLQCQNGMAFEIKVGRGIGLPPSLNQPPPPPYVEPPSTAEVEGQPSDVPVTIVSNNGIGGRSGGGLVCCVVLMAFLSFVL